EAVESLRLQCSRPRRIDRKLGFHRHRATWASVVVEANRVAGFPSFICFYYRLSHIVLSVILPQPLRPHHAGTSEQLVYPCLVLASPKCKQTAECEVCLALGGTVTFPL